MKNKTINPLENERSKLSPELRAEILAEFTALRNEVLNRIGTRYQILTFTLVIAGTILTLGVRQDVSALVLLIYPILAMFLALEWMHIDFRIGEIGDYIKTNVEKRLEGIKWETFIHQRRTTKTIARFFRATEGSAIGVFVVTEFLTLSLAIPRLKYSIEEVILLSSDGLAIIFTFIILGRRRKAMSKSTG